MARPTSFRLPDELLRRLERQAAAEGDSTSALVSMLLDEGLKIRQFPGIVYRDGPAGRRAAVVGGPDVWEIIRAVQQATASGEKRIAEVAGECHTDVNRIRLAVDFYAAFPGEIDLRIAADEKAAAQMRELIERRERLLST